MEAFVGIKTLFLCHVIARELSLGCKLRHKDQRLDFLLLLGLQGKETHQEQGYDGKDPLHILANLILFQKISKMFFCHALLSSSTG